MFGKKWTEDLNDLSEKVEKIENAVSNIGTNLEGLNKHKKEHTCLVEQISDLKEQLSEQESVLKEQESVLSNGFSNVTQGQEGLLDYIKEKLEPLIKERTGEIDKIRAEVDQKLNNFYKEFTDKYFNSINSVLRWQKEVALASSLGEKDSDMAKLKQELMKPLLDEKWKKTSAEEAERINKILKTRGEEIRKMRKEVKNRALEAERKGDASRHTFYKGQLSILKNLLEEENDKKDN